MPSLTARTRVAVIGTMGLPARYGGFETLAQFLVEHLGQRFDFTVYCSAPDYRERPRTWQGARLVYIPFKANGAQSIPFDLLNLLHAAMHAEVLLVLGVSGGLFMPLMKVFRKKTILNIGGLDWQRSKWNPLAKAILRLSERIAVRWADQLVADNIGIANYLRAVYGRESVLIEYGGDQVGEPMAREEAIARQPLVASRYAFSVARIQPDNNPEMILEAFARTPDWPLAFVGDWQRSEFGRNLKQRYQDHPNLHLFEAIYDQQELNALRGHCAIYVHGHSAGGTNPSLVEAMNLGLPIAAFDVIYNRATTEDQASYFGSADALAALLTKPDPDGWEAQRPIMRDIALRRYQWSLVTGKYADLF